MTDYSDLVSRLNGIYRIPITDGLGAAGGEEPGNSKEFVRTFEVPPIHKEAAAAIEALQAKLAAVKPRPIEEAPKDGTQLLLMKIVGHPDHPTALWWVCKGHWSDKWSNWNDGIEPSGLAGPTHFIPLSALSALGEAS